MEFKNKINILILIVFFGSSFVKAQIRYKGELEIDLNKSRGMNYLKEIGKNEYTDLTLYADRRYDIKNLKLDPSIEINGIKAAIYMGKMGDKNISMVVAENFINMEIKGENLMAKKTIRTLNRFEKKQGRKYDKKSGIESRGKYLIIDEEKNREYEIANNKGKNLLECKYHNVESENDKSKKGKFKRKHHNVRDAGIPHFPNEYVGKRSFEIKIWDDNIISFWNFAIPNYYLVPFYNSYIETLRRSSDKFKDVKIKITFAPKSEVKSFYKSSKKLGPNKLLWDFMDKFSNDRKRVINSFNSKRMIGRTVGLAYTNYPEGKPSGMRYKQGGKWKNVYLDGLWQEKMMASWANYNSYGTYGKIAFTHEISHNLGAEHVSDKNDLMYYASYNLYHKSRSNIDTINKSLGFLLKEPSKTVDLGTININWRLKSVSGSTNLKGTSKHAGIVYPAGNMVYKFKVSETANYLLDIQNANYDTYLYLLDENGDLIAKDDDGGVSRYWSRLPWKVLQGGKTYYAIISGYKGSEGYYGNFIIWSHKGLFGRKSYDANKASQNGLELPNTDVKKSNTDNGYSKKVKGLSEEKEGDKIKIYPTVCKYLLNIDNQGGLSGEYFSLKIYDLKGRLVQSNDKQEWGEVRLDKNLTNGMYIVKVETSNKFKFTNKIIVNRN